MCDCVIEAEVVASLTCVEDFCGTCTHEGWSHFTTFWADWDGSTVHFGGSWGHVPDMASANVPSICTVHAHARVYGGHCQREEA